MSQQPDDQSSVSAGHVPGGVPIERLTADVEPSSDPGLVMDAEMPEDPRADPTAEPDRQHPTEAGEDEPG